MPKTPVGLWECASGIAFQKLNYLLEFKYWKCLVQAVSPKLKPVNLEFLIRGNTMTADFIVALITCVVTVINTVVAVLSYLKNK